MIPELFDNPEPVDPESLLDSIPEIEIEVNPSGLTDDQESALRSLIAQFEDEDRPNREAFCRILKLHEAFWKGIQHVFWSERSKDWLKIEDEEDEEAYSNEIINIYRAHGEIIIGALSSSVPSTRYFPGDADNPEDLITARGYQRLGKIIKQHNKANFLLARMLYLLYNQGMIAAYNYTDFDEKYGSDSIPEIELRENVSTALMCPACGEESEGEICEACGGMTMPEERVEEIPVITRMSTQPKGREIIEVWGPLHVKIPFYATDIKQSPYLIFESEQHIALLREIYPSLFDKIQGSPNAGDFDRNARMNVEYFDTNANLATAKRCWIRPWGFNLIEDDEMRAFFKEKFPTGMYAVTIVGAGNDIIAEAREERLDDHWTISRSPFSTELYADPLGKPAIAPQMMRNELISLVVETIRQGIGEVFADPDVLDFNKYGKSKASPGMIYPAKPIMGRGLADSFFVHRGGTLSKDVDGFIAQLDQDTQFLTGAYPSVYGGTAQGGSQTLGEYQMSRNQSLQRLDSTWKIILDIWPDMELKAVEDFRQNMANDENMVVAQGDNFINIWVKKTELEGKVGRVEPESSEQYPLTWPQKRQYLMELLNLGNEKVFEAIFHPDNLEILSSLIGVIDLKIPGNADRNKQLVEIGELLKSPPAGEGVPSVNIEAEVDDHPVHIETCRAFLVSDIGYQLKQSNPEAYANVFFHFMEHRNYVEMMSQPDPTVQNPQDPNMPVPAPESGPEMMNEQQPVPLIQ